MLKRRESSENNPFRHPKICEICCDAARGLNYNVVTCMSCKSFFSRNAHKRTLLSCCQFENNCEITKETRSYCSPCRLQKCLALGMDPELVGSFARSAILTSTSRQLSIVKHQRIKLSMPLPLNLLRNDRSMLTSKEWTLLSNILHVYDEQNMPKQMQSSVEQLASLPPKLRLKSSDTYNMIGHFFRNIQTLIERSPDMSSLSVDARRALTKHNMHSTGTLNGIFICRELDLFNNSIFLTASNTCYGVEFLENCVRTAAGCDLNGGLIKMMLFVMFFASNCSIVTFDNQEPMTTISSSLELIRVQNIYVTMLWKYLIYLYGFRDAVLRFSRLVKTVIDINYLLDSMPNNETHHSMVETIAIDTERVLIIED